MPSTAGGICRLLRAAFLTRGRLFKIFGAPIKGLRAGIFEIFLFSILSFPLSYAAIVLFSSCVLFLTFPIFLLRSRLSCLFHSMENPSQVTVSRLDKLRGSGFLPPWLDIRLPEADDTFENPPEGYTAISTTHVQCGALFPLSPLLQEILCILGLTAAQLTPNSFRILACVAILWERHNLGKLSAEEFFSLYSLRQVVGMPGIHFFYSPRGTILDLPDPNKYWRRLWFYVASSYFGQAPLLWDRANDLPTIALTGPQEDNIDRVRGLPASQRNCRDLFTAENLAAIGWFLPTAVGGTFIALNKPHLFVFLA